MNRKQRESVFRFFCRDFPHHEFADVKHTGLDLIRRRSASKRTDMPTPSRESGGLRRRSPAFRLRGGSAAQCDSATDFLAPRVEADVPLRVYQVRLLNDVVKRGEVL
jgi:hypothetical protein